MAEPAGVRLVRAAAASDFAGARALLADDVEFAALTPKKLFAADGPEGTLEILEDWFAPTYEIEALDSDTVVDQPAVRYRVRGTSEARETFVFEQQAYYDVVDGRISRMHIVCSGDRPVAVSSANALRTPRGAAP